MSGSAPSTLPAWATDAGRVVEPSSGRKGTGWVVTEKPAARHMNWLFNTIYLWLVYYGTKNAAGGVVGLHDSNTSATWTSSAAIGCSVTTTASNGNAIRGIANTGTSAVGVWGSTSSGTSTGAGVYGTSTASDGRGVVGEANTGAAAKGVTGSSTSGFGVHGTSTASGVAGTYGTNSHASGYGVQGVNTGSNGVGVYGVANTGSSAYGVYGESSSGIGVRGHTSGNNSVGGRFSSTGTGTGAALIADSSSGGGGNIALSVLGNNTVAPLYIQPSSSPAGGEIEGQIYYDVSTHKLRVNTNGTSGGWVDLH